MINQLYTHARLRRLGYLFFVPLFLFGLSLLAGCGGGGGGGGGGTPGGQTVTVQGQITDPFNSGDPVDGVTVTLESDTAITTTSYNNTGAGGENGWYSLAGVPANTSVTLKYDDTSTGGITTETFTTGTTTYTENVSYPFSLGGPP